MYIITIAENDRNVSNLNSVAHQICTYKCSIKVTPTHTYVYLIYLLYRDRDLRSEDNLHHSLTFLYHVGPMWSDLAASSITH